MKKLVSLVALLLALLIGVRFALDDSELASTSDSPNASGSPELAEKARLAAADTGTEGRVGINAPRGRAEAESQPLAAPHSETAETGLPFLRVVDSHGAPIPETRGAWVGLDLEVEALLFNEQGIAKRPSGAAGRAFVFAKEYLGRCVTVDRASEPEDALEVVLSPGYELSGKVRVDGFPPGEPFMLQRIVTAQQYGGGMDMERIWDRLVEHGVPPRELAVPVEAGGALTMTVEWDLDLVPLHCPGDLRVRSVNGKPPRYGDRWIAPDGGVTFIEVEMNRIPVLYGRMVWDDGEPVAGAHLDLVCRSASGTRLSVESEITDQGGEFTFAVEGASARLQSIGERLSDDLPREFELVDLAYPHDVGVITLRRPPRLAIEVVGRLGGVERPVVAWVTTGVGGGWTDDAGRVSLAFEPSEPIEVIAEGYRSHRTERVPPDDTLRVVLEPGASLTVILDPKLTAPNLSGKLSVRVAFDRSPFDSAIAMGSPGARSFSKALYGGFQRVSSVSWAFDAGDPEAAGAISFGALGATPLIVPGLVSGAELQVELMDPLGGLLASQRVVVEPSGSTVTFDADDLDVTTLSLEAHWADGSPVKLGHVAVRPQRQGARTFYFHFHPPFDEQMLGPIAPCAVDITSEVPGAKKIQLRDILIESTGPPRSVVLELEPEE